MLCTIWLDAFMRHVLAMKAGTFCSTGMRIRPAMMEKKTRKVIGGRPNNIGRAKVMREPNTITPNDARIANERTPEGVTLRWQRTIFFSVARAFCGSGLIFSRFSEKLQAFS